MLKLPQTVQSKSCLFLSVSGHGLAAWKLAMNGSTGHIAQPRSLPHVDCCSRTSQKNLDSARKWHLSGDTPAPDWQTISLKLVVFCLQQSIHTQLVRWIERVAGEGNFQTNLEPAPSYSTNKCLVINPCFQIGLRSLKLDSHQSLNRDP